MLTAIETTGTISAGHQIFLDDDLPNDAPERVRVIVLYDNAEVDEKEWLAAASKNSAFDLLHNESEDIYSLADGKPVQDEI